MNEKNKKVCFVLQSSVRFVVILNLKVSGGSKMRNLLGYAMKAFKEEKAVVWSGSGAAIGKAISCVEIMKRRYKQTYQLTKICYRK